MTLTIEVADDKAINLLKQLEELNLIRVKSTHDKDIRIPSVVTATIGQDEPFSAKQQSELIALSGSLNMSPERFKEYAAFLHEIRNEWE